MPAIESTMLGLGTPAPDFSLRDVVSGDTVNMESFAGKRAFLVMFICPHCPYVQHAQKELARLGKDYAGHPVGIVAISSNDVAQFPEDGPDGMRQQARELTFNFPYCYDESQQVARAYQAACTPDFFLFDKSRILVYRGQLEGLRAAIEAVLASEPVSPNQKPSKGCDIKWKVGQALLPAKSQA